MPRSGCPAPDRRLRPDPPLRPGQWKMFTARATTSATVASDTRVGRAEGGGVGEGQVEVVEEGRFPVPVHQLRRGHLGEKEVRVRIAGRCPGGRPAPVELPVPQREGDHVGQPDRAAGQQQRHRVVPERSPALGQVVDQLRGRPGHRQADRADQQQPGQPQHGRFPGDPGRVGQRQRHEQQPLQHRQQPARMERQLGRYGQLQRHRHQHGQADRPAVLAPGPAQPGRQVRAEAAGRGTSQADQQLQPGQPDLQRAVLAGVQVLVLLQLCRHRGGSDVGRVAVGRGGMFSHADIVGRQAQRRYRRTDAPPRPAQTPPVTASAASTASAYGQLAAQAPWPARSTPGGCGRAGAPAQ
jgi:hypothetical protein